MMIQLRILARIDWVVFTLALDLGGSAVLKLP